MRGRCLLHDGLDSQLQLIKAGAGVDVIITIGGLRGSNGGGNFLLNRKECRGRIRGRAVGVGFGGRVGTVVLRQRESEANAERVGVSEAIVCLNRPDGCVKNEEGKTIGPLGGLLADVVDGFAHLVIEEPYPC
jgi:hypothetical protein